jgi:hypothetical protein
MRATAAPPAAAPRLDTSQPIGRLLQLLLALASGATSCLMAGYLALCYYFTACLSIPVLDFMVLVCTIKPDNDIYFQDDLAWMDSYKAARWAAAAAGSWQRGRAGPGRGGRGAAAAAAQAKRWRCAQLAAGRRLVRGSCPAAEPAACACAAPIPPEPAALPPRRRRYLVQPLLHSLPQLGLLGYLLLAKRSAMGAVMLGCVVHSALAHAANLLHKAYRCGGWGAGGGGGQKRKGSPVRRGSSGKPGSDRAPVCGRVGWPKPHSSEAGAGFRAKAGSALDSARR